jgi:hypothetical protein
MIIFDKHMNVYPNCSALLIEYVEKKLAPLLQSDQKFREHDEKMSWDEQVAYFDGVQENMSGRDVNLVYFFAHWTQYLFDDYPALMQTLHDEVAKNNSVPVAYHPNKKSSFYVWYARGEVDLTFTVFVIRAMMLKARPAVAESLPVRMDMHLLDWMEELLGMFPMSGEDKSVGEMTAVTVPVVVWSHAKKIIKTCSVSYDTTFGDVIASLGLHDIKSALVGHLNVPFKLMAGDFAPADDYDPEDMPTCLANTFTGKVVDIVFWMAFLGEGPIAEGKAMLADRAKIEPMLAHVRDGYQIHLFTYDHRQDCCEGAQGAFTERDPADTTQESSLWLQLEKEYLTGDRKRFYVHGWTHTSVTGLGALLDQLKACGTV